MKLEEDIFKNNSEIVIYIKKDKEIIHICLIGDLGVRKN